MDTPKIIQGLEWLDKEIKKDQKEIEDHKQKMISEIKLIDRSKIGEQKKKLTLVQKIQKIFGYGKKR